MDGECDRGGELSALSPLFELPAASGDDPGGQASEDRDAGLAEDAGVGLGTTRYFEEQVCRKRPYVTHELCERVIANPLRRETQEDGRVGLRSRTDAARKIG